MKSEKHCLLDVISTLNRRGHQISTFLLRWNDIIVIFDLWTLSIIWRSHIYIWIYTGCRSSHQRCSIKKTVLKNFAIFTRKHLCWSLFLNNVAGLRPATLLKKRFQQMCFPMNFLKNTYFEEHLRTVASVCVLLVFCNGTNIYERK